MPPDALCHVEHEGSVVFSAHAQNSQEKVACSVVPFQRQFSYSQEMPHSFSLEIYFFFPEFM